MIIRKAKDSDLDTLVSFQIRMALETEMLSLAEKVVRAGVLEVLRNPARGFYHVTEIEGNIIACHLVTIEWSDWRNGSIWWIQSLYVLPEHRKKGMFRMMYAHLQEMVKDNTQVKGIRLYVDRNNMNAQKAYEALGMDGDHYTLYEWMDEQV